MMGEESWQRVAQRAQAHRDKTISAVRPKLPSIPAALPQNVTNIPRQLLSERELMLTEMLPEELLPALSTGSLSSEEVTHAFLRRASVAQQLVNCVTEVMSDKALERAKYCDEYLKRHKKPIGLLHGLPISVKEHISMKDMTINCGFVAWIDHVATNDALILQLLRDAGAVFYVRSTEPQLLMHLETASNLYGVTVNPFNRTLTAGGSSGGEGALLGLRGSCLGIGTDIGGSIRSPAANNGVWGFRPTSYRLPITGNHATMLGEEQIVPVVGPLSTSLVGLATFMQAVINQWPWLYEPSLVPLPWNSQLSMGYPAAQPKVKVGVLWHDGVVQPHPPVTRALREVVGRLKELPDFQVVDFPSYKHEVGWDIISSLYFCDGGRQDKDVIAASGEPWLPLSEFILLEQPGVPQTSDTAEEIWAKTCRREQFKTEYAAHWNSTGADDGHPVDVILCPVGPGAAPPLNHARYWAYTSTWNLLDCPAIVFPHSHVNPAQDHVDKAFHPLTEQDAWNHVLYTPERYADAPISLQLVGRRYEDEKVFGIMQRMANVLQTASL